VGKFSEMIAMKAM